MSEAAERLLASNSQLVRADERAELQQLFHITTTIMSRRKLHDVIVCYGLRITN